MKIAIVYDMIYPFNVGGAEIRNYEIATRLSKNHEVHLFGVKLWDGPDVIEKDGLIIHGVCQYPKLDNFKGARTILSPIKFALKLYRPLKKEKFDIIDTSTFVYFHCFTCKLISILNKTPLVFTWHQYWDSYWYSYLGLIKGFIGRQIEKTVKRISANHIAVSQTTRNDLIRAGIKKDKIFLNYNGVDFKKVSSVSAENKIYDLIFVGRLIHQKNVSLLIEAVAILKKDMPQIKVCIVGDGPIRNTLTDLTKKLNLQNNIVFLGFLKDLTDVYQKMKSAKVFVLSSLLEGFGIVVVEANACGLPVVVIKHRWNASQELIDHGQNGLISEGNPEDLADNIKKILLDDDLLKKMTVHSLAKSKNFNWDDIAEDLERYYLNIIKCKPN